MQAIPMILFCENWAWVHQYADPGRGKSWWGPDPRTTPGLTPLVERAVRRR